MWKSGKTFVIFVVGQKDTTTAAGVLGTPTKAKGYQFRRIDSCRYLGLQYRLPYR